MNHTLIEAAHNATWLEELNAFQQAKAASSVPLFQPKLLNSFDVPFNADSSDTINFFQPLIANGIEEFFDNLTGELKLFQAGEHTLPLLITNGNYHDTYACSPYGHYVQLPLESLAMLNNRLARKSASLFIKNYGRLLKMGEINRCVYVNHWLFSTDLYPANFNGKEIKTITKTLSKEFPGHAIIFRSITAATNPELKQALENANFDGVASRQIFVSKPYDPEILQTRIVKSDFKLFKEGSFEFVEGDRLSESDLHRILVLHDHLSQSHQTTLNPRMNFKCLQALIAKRIMQVYALKQNGVITGFVGYLEKGNTMVCPLFGFDKTLEDKSKIYRILSTFLFKEAASKRLQFNQSAGASFYKSVRRAKPEIEYMYVYSEHLSTKQKLAWKLLKTIVNTFAIPFMKQY